MLVTIVTATYKKFDMLEKVIDSVINQNYRPIEYIITDDGSVNFPQEKIDNLFRTKNIDQDFSYRVIRHETNVGTVKNLNNAYAEAKGEIIIPLASDDVFFDACVVEKIVGQFKVRACEVLFTSRLVCDENNNALSFLPHMNEWKILESMSQRQLYEALISKMIYDATSGSCMVLKRECFERYHGFDEKYRLYEDTPFVEKYLRSKAVDFCFDIVSIRYRKGGVSASNNINPLLQEDMDLYDRTDRISRLTSVSLFTKMLVKYDIERRKYVANTSKKLDLFVLRAKGIIPIIIKIYYQIKRNCQKKYERSFILEISNKYFWE